MKRLIVELDDDLHAEIKIAAIRKGKTLKQYVTELIRTNSEKGAVKEVN